MTLINKLTFTLLGFSSLLFAGTSSIGNGNNGLILKSAPEIFFSEPIQFEEMHCSSELFSSFVYVNDKRTLSRSLDSKDGIHCTRTIYQYPTLSELLNAKTKIHPVYKKVSQGEKTIYSNSNGSMLSIFATLDKLNPNWKTLDSFKLSTRQLARKEKEAYFNLVSELIMGSRADNSNEEDAAFAKMHMAFFQRDRQKLLVSFTIQSLSSYEILARPVMFESYSGVNYLQTTQFKLLQNHLKILGPQGDILEAQIATDELNEYLSTLNQRLVENNIEVLSIKTTTQHLARLPEIKMAAKAVQKTSDEIGKKGLLAELISNHLWRVAFSANESNPILDGQYENPDLKDIRNSISRINDRLARLQYVFPKPIPLYSASGCKYIIDILATVRDLHNDYLIWDDLPNWVYGTKYMESITQTMQSLNQLNYKPDQGAGFLETILPNWSEVCKKDSSRIQEIITSFQ